MILSFVYFRAIKSDTEINNERVTSEDSINEYGLGMIQSPIDILKIIKNN